MLANRHRDGIERVAAVVPIQRLSDVPTIHSVIATIGANPRLNMKRYDALEKWAAQDYRLVVPLGNIQPTRTSREMPSPMSQERLLELNRAV
jgi:uncharacterized protein YifN (PemK superfamily)